MRLLIDFNNLAYRSFFAAQRDIKDVGFAYFKHVMLNNIFSNIRKFSPEEVVVAVDSKTNWRKMVFPEYKATRKEKRDKQEDVNWEEMYATMDELVDELKCFFPFKVISIKYMEADDIIASIIRTNQSKEWVVVSSDGDFVQLMRYEKVKIFDPIKGSFMKSDDPLVDLKVKIIAGDGGDNVPCILKESTSEKLKRMDKKKAVEVRLGEKGAEKYVPTDKLKELMSDTTQLLTEDEKPLLKEEKNITIGDRATAGYKRNTLLIDLQYVPEKLVQVCKAEYEEYDMPQPNKIFQYFMDNKFHEFISKADAIESLLTPLYNNYKEENIFS